MQPLCALALDLGYESVLDTLYPSRKQLLSSYFWILPRNTKYKPQVSKTDDIIYYFNRTQTTKNLLPFPPERSKGSLFHSTNPSTKRGNFSARAIAARHCKLYEMSQRTLYWFLGLSAYPSLGVVIQPDTRDSIACLQLRVHSSLITFKA